MSRHRVRAVASLSVAAGCLLLALAAFGPTRAQAAPPANDNFANAQVVGPAVPIAVGATTVGSTAQPGEPPHFSTNPAKHSVWYSWTAPSGIQAVVDVCDHDASIGLLSPTIAVYTGGSLASLTPVASTAGDCVLRFAATSGQNYKIAIDTGNDVGAFTFRLRQLTPPANDAFASAETIGPTLPITLSRSNVDATTEANEPVVNGASGGRSVWFKWTAPASQSVRLDICDFQTRSGSGNKAVSVYTGNSLTTLVTVFSNNTQCRTTFDAVSGTNYKIAFSGNFGGEGSFTLKMLQATPPPNDDFASAIPVGPGLPVSLADDNLFATIQTGEPDHGATDDTTFPPHDSVWYRWTPSTNMQARASVCRNASTSFRVGVYTGSAVGALTRVTPAVPINTQPFCSLRWNAQAGVTYRIAVGGSLEDTEGTFVLDIHKFTPPPNDDFANAQQIGPALPISVGGTTIDAGAQTGEPDHGDDFGAQASVWYRWTPSASEPVRIDTCFSNFESLIGVHRGAALSSLTLVATSEGMAGCPGPFGGEVTMNAVAGTTYFIAVDGFREGQFALAINSLLTPPGGPGGPPASPGTTPFDLKAALKKCKKLKKKAKRHKCIKRAKKKAKLGG